MAKEPLWFADKVLGVSLWGKQKDILNLIRDNREVVVKSCNASGKTFVAAVAVHWWLLSFPNSIVITTAPTGRQVREVLWREIRNIAASGDLYPPNSILQTQLNMGPRWFALGLSTDEPDKFQGFHSEKLLVIVDEASGVTDGVFEAIDGLRPTRLLLIGNPTTNMGRFANDFRMKDVKHVTISAFDTPNLQENKIVVGGLVTYEDVMKMKERYGEDSDVYRVRVLGEFPKSDSDTLIGLDEVVRAMNRDAETKFNWEKKMGVDVARFGNDRTAIVIRQGERVVKKIVATQQDLMAVAGLVISTAKEESVKSENIFVDTIGYGAGVVDRLKEQGWYVSAVNVAEVATDQERFANQRAEIFFKLKDWLKTGSLPNDDDFYELANIKYTYNSKGKIILESKEDMKKRGLDSPDVADALALTMGRATSYVTVEATPAALPYYPELNF